MRLRRIIQDYFTFSKKERNGIIVLLAIIVLLIVANKVIFFFEKPGYVDIEQFLANIAAFEEEQKKEQKSLLLFSFNPNTIDSLALDSLNLPLKIKHNMLGFRNKGGRFYRAEDFRKIYGVNDSIFNAIKNFIDIPEKKNIAVAKHERRTIAYFAFDPNSCSNHELEKLGLTEKQIGTFRKYKKAIGGFQDRKQLKNIYGIRKAVLDSLVKYARIETKPEDYKKEDKLKKSRLIEINRADTTQLKQLKGIGPVLSKRIIKYRDLLGGFYSTHQLKEVYGLQEETYTEIAAYVKVDSLFIQKKNINFLSEKELAMHPYIDRSMAGRIVKYRNKNGSIENIEELLLKMILNKEEYERIRPYLGTN